MRSPVAIALVALALALPAGLTACGGGEEVTATPETVEGTLPEATTEAAETSEEPASTVEGDATAGEAVWASAGCGGCHTLEAAGSTGTIGPNLDDAQPDGGLVTERVANGRGAMPAFKDQLSEKQIADVVAYVVSSTSG